MADDIRYFGPPDDQLGTRHTRLPRAPQPFGLAWVPEEVLVRHNARVLDPRTAPVVSGYPAPAPTIYRAHDLLISYAQRASLEQFNAVLKSVDLKLTDVTRYEKDKRTPFGRAVLSPSSPTTPAVVDAFVALQTLRAAVVENGEQTEGGQHDSEQQELTPRLTKTQVDGIGLNHLMIGTAMGGLGGAAGVLQGVPGAVNGGPYSGSSGADDLGYWRRPVMLSLPRPLRKPDTVLGKRRPVIAVLDTGKAPNEWLNDGFVVVDEELQRDIDRNALPGEAPGGYEDQPPTSEPLIGELSTHSGHSTFIAGLVQQLAPDATILSIRVMHNDGIASSATISLALNRLCDRVTAAQDDADGNTPGMVDIVSLSLGNFLEGDFGTAELTELTKAIDALRARGVIVVASAGNYASSREFYPAALAGRSAAEDPAPDDVPAVISVGALNPNQTKTLFSNDNDAWVTCWARGASLVSTFPQTTNTARNPAIRLKRPVTRPATLAADDPIHLRESMESDDYSAGFATWSGTSFATPLVVGELAKLLLNEDTGSLSVAETIARANKVIKQLGGEK